MVHSADIQYIGLSGYGRKEYLAFLIWAAFKRKRVILFAESWYGNSGWLNAVKGFLLKKTCSGFLVSGIRARLHFKEKLGLGDLPFEMGYSVVDNRHFEQQSMLQKENTLLCVARFAPEKNLELLIAAFQKSNLRGKWNLQLVGGGPLKNTLLNQISSDSDIALHDWMSYKALPNLYAQAKVFILPSLFEPWGLVVNEAMSAGLPVIISSVCGCQPDLVDAQNGFVFEAQNQQALTEVLNQLDQLTDQKITEMGENSRLKMKAFSPEVWANNFIKLALG